MPDASHGHHITQIIRIPEHIFVLILTTKL